MGKNDKRHTKKLSVVERVLENNNTPLAITIENKIKETNDIQNAHTDLKSINGIGDKIASLYLRDLVVVMKINLKDTGNRHLLQPVDIWVGRVVIGLAKDKFSNFDEGNLNKKEKKELAQWIVDNASNQNINPERINMGIWYFCSQIAGSEYRLEKVLEDFGAAKELLDDYKIRIQNICQNC